ncbi:hypothetical protein SADUNF_Sadunf10G0195600 [Salix dunnii]|uniref:Uncharacterized protein n=1 Tax=Salix dunnii TaxID=1413687 RepID=A0A835MSM1_9ROSI|nr:hypothetical protein SADUNF_Sadunf10G0195600 [Salix dunnii]
MAASKDLVTIILGLCMLILPARTSGARVLEETVAGAVDHASPSIGYPALAEGDGSMLCDPKTDPQCEPKEANPWHRGCNPIDGCRG